MKITRIVSPLVLSIGMIALLLFGLNQSPILAEQTAVTSARLSKTLIPSSSDAQTSVPIITQSDQQFNWPTISYLIIPSPDGKSAFIGGDGRIFPLIEIATGKVLQTFYTEEKIRTAVFSPDGKSLLLNNHLYDTATGAKTQTFTTGGNYYTHQAGDISPDGTKALVTQGQNVYYFDIPSNTLLRVYTYTAYIGEVGFATFSPDGTQFVVGGVRSHSTTSGNAIWISDIYTTTPVFYKEYPDIFRIWDAAFSPDGQHLVTVEAEPNGRVRKWNIATGVEEYEYTNLEGFSTESIDIITTTITSTVRTLIAISGEWNHSTIKVGDYDTGDMLMQESATFNRSVSIRFVPGSDTLLVPSYSTVFLVDRDDGSVVRELHASTDTVADMAVSPDGTMVALAGREQPAGDITPARLVLLDNEGKLLHRFGEVGDTNGVAFSPDGRYLLAGTWWNFNPMDDQLHLFDVNSYDLVRSYALPAPYTNETIEKVAFSHDGRWFIAATFNDIFIIDTASGEILQLLQHNVGEMQGIDISPDDSMIAVAKTKIAHTDDHDATFLWDVATGQIVDSFKSSWAWDVAFSPDGSKLAVASGENALDGRPSMVHVWDISSHTLLRSFNPEHEDSTKSIAFSPDGSQLLTGGNDYFDEHYAKLWDYGSGQLLRQFAHDMDVTGVGFAPTGDFIYTWQYQAVSHSNPEGGMGHLWSLDTAPIRQPITELVVDVAQNGTVDQFNWADYAIDAPADANLLVTVEGGGAAVYGRLAEQPTLGFRDYDALTATADGSYQLLIPDTQAGRYYIGVYNENVSTIPFTITAEFVDRHLADVMPRGAGNAGTATLQISGLGFESGMAASLYRNGAKIANGSVSYQSSTALAAAFDLNGVQAGTYDLQLMWSDSQTAVLNGAFVVANGVGSLLESHLHVPPNHRPDRQYTAQIRYENVGDSDMTAPLYHLTTNKGAVLACGNGRYASTVQMLGIPSTGDARTIPPNGSGQLPFTYTGLSEDMNFQLDVLFSTKTAVNWNDHKETMRPSTITAAEWNTIFPVLTAQLGATWGDYLHTLGNDAERLRLRGEIPYCVSDHLEMEIRKAQGEPTAAIAGTLQNAESSAAIGSVIVTAYTDDGSGGFSFYRDRTNFANGRFSIPNLPAGVYTVTAEGYYFTPPITISISGDADVVDHAFLAAPVPAGPDEADPVVPTANHAPALAVDGQGNALMVWQRYGQLWAAEYDDASEQWKNSGVMSGTVGSIPALAYGSTVADGNPGYTALWRNGTGNSGQLHYATITHNSGGQLQWSTPITLTNSITGTAGDTSPAVAIADNGNPLALWLRRNWDAQDDTDLYYQSFDPPPLTTMRTWVIVPADQLQEFARSPLAPLAEHCVGVSIKEGKSLPSWVPLIGGKYGFEVTGSGCGEMSCDLEVSGNLEVGVDFSDRVSGSGSGSVGAKWSTNPDQPPCKYVFDSASLGLGASVEGKVPAFMFSIPLIVELEAGAVIGGDVSGQIEWEGSNFPGYPSGGEVELTASIGPYGSATFIKVIEAEVKGTGQVKAKYTAPSTFTFEGWCMNLNATAKAWILSYSFDKSWGTACNGRMMLLSPASSAQLMRSVTRSTQNGVPVVENLTIQVESQVGTGNIYTGTGLGGSPVLSATISSDLTNDGDPAIARNSSGEMVAAWTKDSADQTVSVGSSVVVASSNGMTFTLPITIANADQFNKHVDIAFISDTVPMAVWAGADASGISLASTYTDVLDAIDNNDIYYSRRVGGIWSAPAKVYNNSGDNEQIRLAGDGSGNAVVVWSHTTSESESELFASFWDGSSWSSGMIGNKASGMVESLDIVYTGNSTKTPLLVWSQDMDGDPETLNDLAVFYTRYSGGSWAAPTMLDQAAVLQGKSSSSTLRNGVVWKSPTACSSWGGITPPSSCCPEPPPPPEPPKPPKPQPAPQPVEPPEKGEGNGSYTVDDDVSTAVTSSDPNEKVGLAGWDGHGAVISGTRMVYSIYFENMITATAPAQEVFVTDTLSSKLDWTTLRFEEVAFGDTVLPIISEGNSFQTLAVTPDYRYATTTTWQVDIAGQIDLSTGELGWTFRTLDVETGLLPADAAAGFLPPNDATGRGEGHVTFSVEMRPGLAAGTVITNQASIVFDTNPVIMTNVYENRVGSPIIYLPIVVR